MAAAKYVDRLILEIYNYIHLTAEYKLPILSLKRLKLYTNTIKITILEYKSDLFSAWSEQYSQPWCTKNWKNTKDIKTEQ